MVCGFVERVVRPGMGTVVLAAGGTRSALGAYVFVYVIWRTVDGPSALRKAEARARTAVNASAVALPIA